MTEDTTPNSAPRRNILDPVALRIRSLTVAGSMILFAVTLLSLFAESWWLADICANLRVQWVIGLSSFAIAAVLQKQRSLLAWQLIAMCVHIPWLAVPVSSAESPSVEPLITVTTANVLTPNRRYADIEDELLRTNADVIAILELSTGLAEHLDGRFAKAYPFARIAPQNTGNFGIGLYFRQPFESAVIDYFNDERIQSVVAKVAVNGQLVRIIVTHTLPPMGPGSFRHRNKHLQMLADCVRKFRSAEPDVPVIVMGDLNVTPWSPVFQKFRSSADIVSAPHGWTPTWFRYPAFPFGLILDHVLASRDLQSSGCSVGRDIGSDHRFVTVAFRRMRPDAQ